MLSSTCWRSFQKISRSLWLPQVDHLSFFLTSFFLFFFHHHHHLFSISPLSSFKKKTVIVRVKSVTMLDLSSKQSPRTKKVNNNNDKTVIPFHNNDNIVNFDHINNLHMFIADNGGTRKKRQRYKGEKGFREGRGKGRGKGWGKGKRRGRILLREG